MAGHLPQPCLFLPWLRFIIRVNQRLWRSTHRSKPRRMPPVDRLASRSTARGRSHRERVCFAHGVLSWPSLTAFSVSPLSGPSRPHLVANARRIRPTPSPHLSANAKSSAGLRALWAVSSLPLHPRRPPTTPRCRGLNRARALGGSCGSSRWKDAQEVRARRCATRPAPRPLRPPTACIRPAVNLSSGQRAGEYCCCARATSAQASKRPADCVLELTWAIKDPAALAKVEPSVYQP